MAAQVDLWDDRRRQSWRRANLPIELVKLIFLNRYFYPDHSATSQILSDLAFGLAARGQAVRVITSRQRYDAPAEKLAPKETLAGVSVDRVWTSRFGRANLLGRAIDYVTFCLSAAWHLWCLARRGDVVIAKTDPPMLSVITSPVCRLRGAKPINWLQDIFPETAQALGVARSAVPYGLLRWLRNKSLRDASMNVVLGERMAARLSQLGIAKERIRVIANWADGTAIAPIDHAVNPLRAEWDLEDAFVVAYSGNLGRVHDMHTLLGAMDVLQQGAQASAAGTPRGKFVWLFIGGGALTQPMREEVARRRLTHVRFKPYQPRGLLAQSLSAADVHLVSLRPELEGLIVPSKFYGICAAGRPTVFVGDKDGEIARLIDRYQCGRTVEAGDRRGLASTVRDLAADRDSCRQMGQRARQAFEREFDKARAVTRWQDVLREVAGGSDAVCAQPTTVAPPARDAR